MMKIRNSIFILPLSLMVLFVACARQNSNIQPIGTYCGISGQEYKNPFDNETIDEEVFAEIATIPEQTYKAESLNLLVKNTTGKDEQVQYAHRQVFSDDQSILDATFVKTCARGLTPESIGTFEATLPVTITLKNDLTWTAEKAATYQIKYGVEFSPQGFLVGSVEDSSGVNPSSPVDFDFSDYIFLEQIGKLSSAQKALKAKPETALDQIFMQIKVSDNPSVFARINFRKVTPPNPQTQP